MEFVNIVNRFYTPPLCLFGVVGNCLSVYIFVMTSNHRNLSSSYYLSAIAISDIGFLINLFAVWLTVEGYEVITTKFSCPLIMYLGQVTCFLSVWFVVAFTVERFFAVCYPLTRPTVCTVARAKKVILGITLLSLFGFSYVWIIADVVPEEIHEPELRYLEANNTGVNASVGNIEDLDAGMFDEFNNTFETKFRCSVPTKYHEISGIASHLDSFFTLILPFCVIAFLNIRITLCVWQLKSQRENIVAIRKLNRANSSSSGNDKSKLHVFCPSQTGYSNTPNSSSSGLKIITNTSPRPNNPHHLSSSTAEARVTKTLLLVSTVFLVLNLPSHAVRAMVFILKGFSEDHSNGDDLPSYIIAAQIWAHILFNTNFSVNFLLYCVSGKNFRKSLRSLCFDDRNGKQRRKRMITKPFTKCPYAVCVSRPRSNQAVDNDSNGRKNKRGLKAFRKNSFEVLGVTGFDHHCRNNSDSSLGNQEATQGIHNLGGDSEQFHDQENDNNPEISFYPTSLTEVETYA